MRFTLIDRVIEDDPTRLVAIKQVSAAEEYLADHFPGFPILPGVFMLEAGVQACREHLRRHPIPGIEARRAVLGSARALKYGAMVPPGSTLRIVVTRRKPEVPDFKMVAEVSHPEHTAGEAAAASSSTAGPSTAAQGRLVLRPLITS